MATRTVFDTTLLSVDGRNTGIEVPQAALDELNAAKRVPVLVRIGGFVYPSTIAVMGGKYLIPFSADKRAATGLGAGDPITVELTHDDQPRTVEVPEDFAAAMAGAGVRDVFDALSPSRRKAHVTAIESAKAAETRARRIAAAVAGLS